METVRILWETPPIQAKLVKSVQGHAGMYELRMTVPTKRALRVAFCVTNKAIWMLHGFIKKDVKRQSKEFDVAAKRMERVLSDN